MAPPGLLGALTGDLTARVGLARSWSISMLVLAAATATFALAVRHYAVILAAAAVFGAVYIALTGLQLLWGVRIYPDHPAFGVGAPFFLIAAGQAIGSPLIGLLSDATTATIAFGVAAAGLAVGAAVSTARKTLSGNDGLCCRVERVDDVGRDASAGGHVVSVAARPVADRRALFAIDRRSPAARSGRTTAPATADPAARVDPLLQVVPKLCGILGRKVDLIAHPVEPEFDRLIGGAFAVEIIDQRDGHFLRH